MSNNTNEYDSMVFNNESSKIYNDLGIKIYRIRKSLKMGRHKFSEIMDISEYALKNYESNYRAVPAKLLINICNHELTKRYALWLILDKISVDNDQIEAPAINRLRHKQIS